MKWIDAALALLSLVSFLFNEARERRLKSEGAAEAFAAAARGALHDIRKAREARLHARADHADPRRLREDDGFRRQE